MGIGTIGKVIGVGVAASVAANVVRTLVDGGDADVPPADLDAARAAALRTLDHIDWSRPVIVVWAPGTNVRDIGWKLDAGIERAAGGADQVSIARLEYPASGADMAASVAVGAEAMRMVLEEIRRRDPDGRRYHVALTGESQGAWVLNDLLAREPFDDVVDRVALYSVPSLAAHDGALRDDSRVRVVNHRLDPVTWRMLGSADAAASAGGTFFGGGGADSVLATIDHAIANPVHVAVLGAATLDMRLTGDRTRHPHVYDREQRAAADHLLAGYAPA